MSAIVGVPAALGGAVVSAASHLGMFIPVLIAAIAYYQYDLMDPESRPINVETMFLLDHYDFIVIGAGTAGKKICYSTTTYKVSNFYGCLQFRFRHQ